MIRNFRSFCPLVAAVWMVEIFSVPVMRAASPPDWWTSGSFQVIDPSAAKNDFGPASVGQAKWMAYQALGAINSYDPALATAITADLVGFNKPILNWDPPVSPEDKAKQHAPLLIGQLKAIAAPFYTHINALAPVWLASQRAMNLTETGDGIFPWTDTDTSDDSNLSMATIGQLKAVFSLRFSESTDGDDFSDFSQWVHNGSVSSGDPVDTDHDGMPDVWENQWGLNPNDPSDAAADSDGDGVSNLREYALNTPPTGRYRAEVIPLATSESVGACGDTGNIVVRKSPAHILDINGNWDWTTIGDAYVLRQTNSLGAVVESPLPFGNWYKPGVSPSYEYHTTLYSVNSDGSVSGFHSGVLATPPNPSTVAPGAMNFFTIYPGYFPAASIDWETMKSQANLTDPGWGTQPNVAFSTGGEKFLMFSAPYYGVFSRNGDLQDVLPITSPDAGTSPITWWYSPNDNGDVVGVNGSWMGWWDASLKTVKTLHKPAEWGTDYWAYPGRISNDQQAVIVRYTMVNGVNQPTSYLWDLQGRRPIRKIQVPVEGGDVVGLSDDGRVLGSGPKPWISKDGGPPVKLEKVMLTNQSPSPELFSATGWTINQALHISPQGNITVEVTLPNGGGEAAVTLYPDDDRNHNGIPDDAEADLRSQLIAKFDLNRDGVLSTQELAAYNQQYPGDPDHLDPNTDYTGSGFTLSQGAQRGVYPSFAATKSTKDSDGDGIPDYQDADPNDATINWRMGPRPNFVVCEMKIDTSQGAALGAGVGNADGGKVMIQDMAPGGDILYFTGPAIEDSSPVGSSYVNWHVATLDGQDLTVGKTTPANYPGGAHWFYEAVPQRLGAKRGGSAQVLGFVSFAGEEGAELPLIGVYPFGAHGVQWRTGATDFDIGDFGIPWMQAFFNYKGDYIRFGTPVGQPQNQELYFGGTLLKTLEPGNAYLQGSLSDSGVGTVITNKSLGKVEIWNFGASASGTPGLVCSVDVDAASYSSASIARLDLNDSQGPQQKELLLAGGNLWVSDTLVGAGTPHFVKSKAAGAKISSQGWIWNGGHDKDGDNAAMLRVNGAWTKLSDLLNPGVGTTGVQLKQVFGMTEKGVITAEIEKGSGTKIVQLVPCTLGVDNDRDGFLSLGSTEDQTTLAHPYRFWLNNDYDAYGSTDDYNSDLDRPGTTASPINSGDEVINFERDLEDLTRLHVNLGSFLRDQLIAGTAGGATGVKASLKWKKIISGDPAIRVFDTRNSTDPDGTQRYLSDPGTAYAEAKDPDTTGPYPDPKFPTQRKALGLVDGTSTAALDPKDFAEYSDIDTKHFLYEGVKEGKGELEIVLTNKDGTVIGEGGSVFLELIDIRRMYERGQIDPAALIPPPNTPIKFLPARVGAVAAPAGFSFVPAWDEEKSYVIHVHGWNKTENAGHSDEITMYKRMWHRGFKGRFAGFHWPTPIQHFGSYTPPAVGGFTPPPITYPLDDGDYNYGEYTAWVCGPGFKSWALGLKGTDFHLNVICHSMGNVVVSSALRAGLKVDHVCLLNAAIPAECFDSSPALIEPEAGLSLYGVPYTAWAQTDLSYSGVPAVRALGYLNQLDSSATAGVFLHNFHLKNDAALSGPWVANQAGFGGQFLGILPIRANPKPVPGYKWTSPVFFDTTPPRNITDPYEGMSMVDQSSTKALGAQGATHGSITNGVNMDVAPMLFDTEHEAEFKWRMSRTWGFFQNMMQKMGYAFSP